MNLFNWFKRPKKESKAARMFKSVQGMDSDMAVDADPIKLVLKTEVPKFAKEMALQKGMSLESYMEHLLIDSLYVNRAVNQGRQDRMMGAMSSHYLTNGSKMVN